MISELKKSNHVFQFNTGNMSSSSERPQRSQSAYYNNTSGSQIHNHPFLKQRQQLQQQQGYQVRQPEQMLNQSIQINNNINQQNQNQERIGNNYQRENSQHSVQSQPSYLSQGGVDPALENNPIDRQRASFIIKVNQPYSNMFYQLNQQQQQSQKQNQNSQEQEQLQYQNQNQDQNLKQKESYETEMATGIDRSKIEDKICEIKNKLVDLESQTQAFGQENKNSNKDENVDKNLALFNKQQLLQIADLIGNVKQLEQLFNQGEESSHQTPFKGGNIHQNNLKNLNFSQLQQYSTNNTLNGSQIKSNKSIQNTNNLKSSYAKAQVQNVKQNLENKFNDKKEENHYNNIKYVNNSNSKNNLNEEQKKNPQLRQSTMSVSKQSLKATPNPLLNKRISLTKLQSSNLSENVQNCDERIISTPIIDNQEYSREKLFQVDQDSSTYKYLQQNINRSQNNKYSNNEDMSNSQIYNRNLQNFNSQFPLLDQKIFAKPTNYPNSSLRNSQILLPESHRSVDPNSHRSHSVYKSQQYINYPQSSQNIHDNRARNTMYDNRNNFQNYENNVINQRFNSNINNNINNNDMQRHRSASNFRVVKTEETVIVTTTTRRVGDISQLSQNSGNNGNLRKTGTKLDDYFDNQRMSSSVHLTPRSSLYQSKEEYQQQKKIQAQQQQNSQYQLVNSSLQNSQNLGSSKNIRQSLIQDFPSNYGSNVLGRNNNMDMSDYRAQKQKEYQEQFVKKQMENLARQSQQVL